MASSSRLQASCGRTRPYIPYIAPRFVNDIRRSRCPDALPSAGQAQTDDAVVRDYMVILHFSFCVGVAGSAGETNITVRLDRLDWLFA